jgi:ABC-type multidrug transport system fused ATPase/permease subunit
VVPLLLCRSWAADNPAHFYTRFDDRYATQLYILIYMVLVCTFWIMLLCRDTVFSMWAIKASTNLHNQLFTRVLNAPMLFFLRTPVGDVLNAFARDQVGPCAVSMFASLNV